MLWPVSWTSSQLIVSIAVCLSYINIGFTGFDFNSFIHFLFLKSIFISFLNQIEIFLKIDAIDILFWIFLIDNLNGFNAS